MKKFFGFLFFISSVAVFSQEQGTIAGTILDQEVFNEPLIYAEVHLKETSKRVQTNFHGNFEITGIAPGNYT
ncbi:MAG: carboxypeptidase-like regulatory domain-containing protein, partial [Muriicola sp.]